jgi:NADPH-ferrihemoprotein reductase
MEDDFLAWKPKLFGSLAPYFGVDDVGGKANREAPHCPLFETRFSLPADHGTLYRGELSSDGSPRNWKLNDDGSKFVEVSSKKRILYDAKNPHFSRISQTRHLFQSAHDNVSFNKGEIVPASTEYDVLDGGKKVRLERYCIHVDLDLAGSGLRYESGDHVGVYAPNDESEVLALARALKVSADLDNVVSLAANPENKLAHTAKAPFPTPCTLRTALTYYLAVKSTIKQHQLEILAKYAASEIERAAIYELVDDRDLYLATIEHSQMNLAEVLEAFPSIQVPLSVVLGEVLARIQVRYYSISSSSKKDPTKVSVTAVVVRYVLPSVRPTRDHANAPAKVVYKEGLATSMFHRLLEKSLKSQPDSSEELVQTPFEGLYVPIFIRTSSFRLPRDPAVPIVMVGPGTGVAPFRAFVHERAHLAETRAAAGVSKPVGSTWLFYGCRHPEQDHLYKDEFASLQNTVSSWKASGSDESPDARVFDLQFFNAFSRVEGGKKVYVQHLLAEKGKEVWELLTSKRGYFYICG